jgi:signal transduction histidine kinase
MERPSSEPVQPGSSFQATDHIAEKDLPEVVVALLDRLADGDIAGIVRRFRRSEYIIHEGQINDAFYLILEGRVHLTKRYGDEAPITVGTLEAGELVGLLSFASADTAFSSARAKTDVITLRFTRSEFDRLPIAQPELAALLQPLIVTNLVERYRRIVTLHLEVAALTREIEGERNRLQEALTELHSTRNRLIHQEKMAILGQLVAGVAHELNNPASAMLRGAENLAAMLPETVRPGSSQLELRMLQLGQTRSPRGTEEQNARMEMLARKYPHIRRSDIRILAQMPEESVETIADLLRDRSTTSLHILEGLLRWFEIGMFLKNIQVSGNRISNIVQSLRSYSRQSKSQIEEMDLGRGIQDTLLLVADRLKNIKVSLLLATMPPVRCRPGEINQVWTNIILNACDAMQDRGSLLVRTELRGDRDVVVTIADSGPGIPEHILPKIFEPNFTTKTASGSFGLGLGLAISNEIVREHGGEISLRNAPEGGAVCTVVLPLEGRAVTPAASSPAE